MQIHTGTQSSAFYDTVYCSLLRWHHSSASVRISRLIMNEIVPGLTRLVRAQHYRRPLTLHCVQDPPPQLPQTTTTAAASPFGTVPVWYGSMIQVCTDVTMPACSSGIGSGIGSGTKNMQNKTTAKQTVCTGTSRSALSRYRYRSGRYCMDPTSTGTVQYYRYNLLLLSTIMGTNYGEWIRHWSIRINHAVIKYPERRFFQSDHHNKTETQPDWSVVKGRNEYEYHLHRHRQPYTLISTGIILRMIQQV